MLNPGSHSEYFEELCALAAAGQISEAEFRELQEHMRDCADCRSAYADFIDLLHNKLPLADSEVTGAAGFFSRSSSYRERFLARARREGVNVSEKSHEGRSLTVAVLWPGMSYALAVAVLLATVGILGYNLRQTNAGYARLAADMAAMSHRISQQHNAEVTAAREVAAPPPVETPSRIAPDGELEKARQEYAAAEARSKAFEGQLQTAVSELEALRARREEESGSRNQLEKKLGEAELALTGVSDELQKVRQGRSDDASTIATQNLRIRELSARFAEQTESLERERTLLAAGRDIHDLMGARNLHIVDVLDVDSKGKDRRAFGRVFYTEGKSLIFYAFDLGDRSAARRNASFQVWGARGPAQTQAQSLGIFFVDDQKQNRWVLKFEDPSVLAEIDSVFVTVERPGGSPRPTGRKFLYAYLKANPNHP